MGYSAKWKVLEDLMVELRRKGFETPSDVIGDLRNAKMMISLAQETQRSEAANPKLEEILGNIESNLINEAQTVLDASEVDQWLRRLAEASFSICEVKFECKDNFVSGVPRDQKWVRVEPLPNLSTERLAQIAGESSLSVSLQKDGRLVVYGKQEAIKVFLKKMSEEATKRKPANSLVA